MGATVGHFALIGRAKTHGHASARDAELFAMGVVATAVLASYFAGTSLAGLFTGAFAAYALSRVLGLSFLSMFDAMFFALPFGWFFLRAGCALIHDHVGLPSTSALAVDFPTGGAFDLGVLEVVFTPGLVLFSYLLGKKKWEPGVLGASVGLAFAALRFFVNFASVDRRFLGLTSFQWVCVVAALVFLALVRRGKNAVHVRSNVA